MATAPPPPPPPGAGQETFKFAHAFTVKKETAVNRGVKVVIEFESVAAYQAFIDTVIPKCCAKCVLGHPIPTVLGRNSSAVVDPDHPIPRDFGF